MNWLIYSLILPLFGALTVAHASCGDESLYHSLARVTLNLLDQGKLDRSQVDSMVVSAEPVGPFGTHAPKVNQLSAVQLYRAHLSAGIRPEDWERIRGALREGLAAREAKGQIAAEAREVTAEVLAIREIPGRTTTALFRTLVFKNKTYRAFIESRLLEPNGRFRFTYLVIRIDDSPTPLWDKPFDLATGVFSFRILDDGSPAAAVYASASGWGERLGTRYYQREQYNLATGQTSSKKIALRGRSSLRRSERWTESSVGAHVYDRPDLAPLLEPFFDSVTLTVPYETSKGRLLVAVLKSGQEDRHIEIFEPKVQAGPIARYPLPDASHTELHFVERLGEPLLLVTYANQDGILSVYDPSVDGQAVQSVRIANYEKRFVEQDADGQVYVRFFAREYFTSYLLFARTRP